MGKFESETQNVLPIWESKGVVHQPLTIGRINWRLYSEKYVDSLANIVQLISSEGDYLRAYSFYKRINEPLIREKADQIIYVITVATVQRLDLPEDEKTAYLADKYPKQKSRHEVTNARKELMNSSLEKNYDEIAKLMQTMAAEGAKSIYELSVDFPVEERGRTAEDRLFETLQQIQAIDIVDFNLALK